MKKMTVLTLLFVFIANTFVLSAWAKPCMHDVTVEETQEVTKSMTYDMPCHEHSVDNKEKPESQNTHCDSVCLCLHISLHQTPILGYINPLDFSVNSKQQIIISPDNLTSRSILPPRRPPKTKS